MRFLLTNDDGIDCAFLHAIVRALLVDGHELYVVAPRTEQSWIGAAKSRDRRVHSTRAEKNLGCPTWIVDGTPSDCVNIALDHLLPVQPDAVVSGINVGLNASLGFIIASGTIGGAWEGALHGLPSFALSQNLTFDAYDIFKAGDGTPPPAMQASLDEAARHSARLVPELFATTPRNAFIVHNLNFPFPCRADSELRRTVPAQAIVPRLFSAADDDSTHRLIFRLGEDLSPPEPLTDRQALERGYISHTVLDYTKLGR